MDVADCHLTVEIELSSLTLVLSMKVCRLVLVVEHPNYDSEEHRDNWHAQIAPYLDAVVGLTIEYAGQHIRDLKPSLLSDRPAIDYKVPLTHTVTQSTFASLSVNSAKGLRDSSQSSS